MADTAPRSGTVIHYAVGDDVPLQWQMQERDGEDLAAGRFAARCQVRRSPSGPVLHEWSTVNGRAVFEEDPAGSGTWYLRLLVDDSRDWTWERGEFDLFIADPLGRNERIDSGIWINDPAVGDRTPKRAPT